MKKQISFILALVLVVTAILIPVVYTQATADPEGNVQDKELYLHVGSPIALSDGEILPLDQDNPDLAPVINKQRTLVPLRFISEFFSAEVSYDEDTQSGIVEIGSQKAVFPANESYYYLNGTKTQLDTETLVVDQRIFLPLRALCEQVLDLEVDYQDQVIYIGQTAALTDAKVAQAKESIGLYVKVSSYDELQTYVMTAREALSWTSTDMIAESNSSAEAADGAATPEARKDESNAVSGDHSETNTQVEGVDEADIIKTDGEYIYLLSGNQLKIVKAGDQMTLVGTVPLKDKYASEMYVDGDRLIVIGTRYEYEGEGGGVVPYDVPEADMAYTSIMPYFSSTFAFADVYDIEDKSDVKLLRNFEVEGSVVTTRKQGDYVYLLSSLSVWSMDDTDVPLPRICEDGKVSTMDVSDVMIMPGKPMEAYLTLSAIHVNDKEVSVESESITGSGYTTYMSQNAMYIALDNYYADNNNDYNTVQIAKFSINGGSIGYAGSGAIKGYLHDQFSMDEYQGYLRVTTTVFDWENENQNNLYILDGNMKVCGSVLNFAPGESIYSARFMGARGYVVTFRTVDPLFTFDLSDPTNPKITGELKIPGFSSYLHPVSETILLGVGSDVKDVYTKDADGNEVVISQQTGGIKISLFDVSDMGKPKEIDSMILGERGYAALQSNHKAAMFKSSDDLFGFTGTLYSLADYDIEFSGAFLISYQGGKLTELGRIKEAVGYDETDFYFEGRLVYIGDTLYYAESNLIRSFDLSTLEQIQSLKLT